MTLAQAVRQAGAGMLLMFGLVLSWPAVAQVTFGSPDDPPRVALGGGAFNVFPKSKKTNAASVLLVTSEYRFGDKLWIFSPFIGAMGTTQGAFYGYFGFGFDVNLPYNLVFTPTAAAGYFYAGQGFSLGSRWEFRTGAELAYRFADQRRIGVGFYHVSNAGLGDKDPGAEMADLVFTVPFH